MCSFSPVLSDCKLKAKLGPCHLSKQNAAHLTLALSLPERTSQGARVRGHRQLALPEVPRAGLWGFALRCHSFPLFGTSEPSLAFQPHDPDSSTEYKESVLQQMPGVPLAPLALPVASLTVLWSVSQ